jgi:hypothetical protein
VTVIDGHCHVPSTRFLPRRLIEASARNVITALAAAGLPFRESNLVDSFVAGLQDHSCDQFVADMDTAGVDRAVLLLPDFTYVLPDSGLDISEMIRQYAAILDRHPGRFYYMCGVDPRWGAEGVDIFERAVREQNCSGLKLYPPCGYSPSDRALFPYYEICRNRALPVLLHTGPTAPLLTFNYSDPALIDDAAREFPEVSFILAHGGVNNVETACLMAAYRPNVYLDLSGYPASVDSRGVAGSLRSLFNRRLNHKIIFGTDWPIFKLSGPYQDLVAIVKGEEGVIDELDDREISLVLGGTMQRLLPVA